MIMILTAPWLKALSGLCINLSAAWFVLAFVTPNFELSRPDAFWVLTYDIYFGIVFLLIAVKLEKYLESL